MLLPGSGTPIAYPSNAGPGPAEDTDEMEMYNSKTGERRVSLREAGFRRQGDLFLPPDHKRFKLETGGGAMPIAIRKRNGRYDAVLLAPDGTVDNSKGRKEMLETLQGMTGEQLSEWLYGTFAETLGTAPYKEAIQRAQKTGVARM